MNSRNLFPKPKYNDNTKVTNNIHCDGTTDITTAPQITLKTNPKAIHKTSIMEIFFK